MRAPSDVVRSAAARLCAAATLLALLVMTCVPVAMAQDKPPPPLPAYVSAVVAPGATCSAVNDSLALLVVGHNHADFQLSLHPLDDKGVPKAGEPTRLKLPRPEKLAPHQNYALGVAFHPTLPILYVWQDIAGSPGGDNKTDPAYTEFDHLLIFEIKDGKPEPLRALARGPEFVFKQSFGLIAVTPGGDRLFVPNLRDPANNRAALGSFELDSQGLPIVIEGEPRLARIDIANLRPNPSGWGFVCGAETVAVFSGPGGPATWDVENRRASLNALAIANIPANAFVGGHPSIPMVFGSAYNGNLLYRMAHSDGYITLQPVTFTLQTGNIHTPPVIMPGRPVRMALGGANAIQILPLDAQFNVNPATAQVFPVKNPTVRAVTWSDKFARLYVGVEPEDPVEPTP